MVWHVASNYIHPSTFVVFHDKIVYGKLTKDYLKMVSGISYVSINLNQYPKGHIHSLHIPVPVSRQCSISSLCRDRDNSQQSYHHKGLKPF